MIYVREVFTSDQGSIFFFMIVLILIFKYCLRVINTEEDDKMNQRNRIKTFNLINDKGLDYSQNKPETLDLDITDVIYDEERL